MIAASVARPACLFAQGSAVSALTKAINPVAPAQNPPAEVSPAPNAGMAIPLPEVADQAERLDSKLEEVSDSLAANRQFLTQNGALFSETAESKERASRVDGFLAHSPDILQLRDELVYWKALSQQSADLRKSLAARAAELQRQVDLLKDEEARWKATQSQIGNDSGLEAVQARVAQELEGIGSTRSQAQEQLNQVLTLQNQLSLAGRQISDALVRLNKAELEYRGHLFAQDSLPLWNPQAFRETDQPMEILLRRSADRDYQSTGGFLRAAVFRLLWLPLVFMLSFFALVTLRRYLQSSGLKVSEDLGKLLAKPYLLALLATLQFSIPEADSAPSSVVLVLYFVWICLILQLDRLLVPAGFQRIARVAVALNAAELFRVAVPSPPVVNRILLTLILAGALGALIWLARPSVFRGRPLARGPLLLWVWCAIAAMVLIGVALAANICGFASLSRVLGIGTLVGGLYALGLYCSARVALLLLAVFLESPWALPFSPEIRQSIGLWGRRGVVAVALVFWWTHSQLYLLLFRDSIAQATSAMLGYSFGLGSVSFTLGTVLGVILILVVGSMAARIASSLLRSVLIARLPIQRGLPYAISKFAYYAMILLVLFAAIARAGVELNKFTVITGALGVGLAFGLQNIVNNFASGLILLVERPIRVGDVVEVNGLVGSVGRIGARSSTISTAQGAEVIVPNSNLISNQVVNWTLSSPFRRVEIPVGVAYGSDPEAILALLVAVAAEHPAVMKDPGPLAFFLGFGDSALNFELRFWSERQEIWFQLKSDVSVAIAKALKDAGIEIPFPQRDLHLRSMDLNQDGRERIGAAFGNLQASDETIGKAKSSPHSRTS
jgi:potassium efflux system protein